MFLCHREESVTLWVNLLYVGKRIESTYKLQLIGQSDNFDNQHVLLGEDQERTCKLSGEPACFGVKCPVATFAREHVCFYRLKTGLVDHVTCFCLPQLRTQCSKLFSRFITCWKGMHVHFTSKSRQWKKKSSKIQKLSAAVCFFTLKKLFGKRTMLLDNVT